MAQASPGRPGKLAYAVVSPVKDEGEHLALTAESLVAQSHRPVRWVIVDDGSSDATGLIAERYAARHSWITVVGSNGGTRARGAPVVAAFERGRRAIAEPHEIVAKLDGDLMLPGHYFEWVAETFARAPRAGIVGGMVLFHNGTEWTPERVSGHTVQGAVKAYRVACLDEIGGLRPSMGWDGIDEYGARARGWSVHPLSELRVLHYRPRGSRRGSLRARWEEGRGAHFMGYLPAFLLGRAAYRAVVDPPPLIGGLVLLAGYLHAAALDSPSIDDPLARQALRAEQRRRLRRLLLDRGAVDVPVLPGGGPAMWAAESARHRRKPRDDPREP
jgi:biofilm PGA synthesis N-glycosyltransferase PgaC